MLLSLAIGITLSQARLAAYVPPRPILTEAEDVAIRKRAAKLLKNYVKVQADPKDFGSSIERRKKLYTLDQYLFCFERDGTLTTFSAGQRAGHPRSDKYEPRLTRTQAIQQSLSMAKDISGRKHLVYKVYDVTDVNTIARITIEDTKTPWTCIIHLRQEGGYLENYYAIERWIPRRKPGQNPGPVRQGAPRVNDLRSKG